MRTYAVQCRIDPALMSGLGEPVRDVEISGQFDTFADIRAALFRELQLTADRTAVVESQHYDAAIDPTRNGKFNCLSLDGASTNRASSNSRGTWTTRNIRTETVRLNAWFRRCRFGSSRPRRHRRLGQDRTEWCRLSSIRMLRRLLSGKTPS